MQESTFLNNAKIDGELYALFQSFSVLSEDDKTVVYKSDLPTQKQMCEILGIKSTKTYRAHLTSLIEHEYVIEENKRYILPKMELIYLLIPLETLQFLKDTLHQQVIKIYIYLSQRYKYKKNYVFTAEELGEHIGLQVHNNARHLTVVNNALLCLKNNGLIDYEEFIEKNIYTKKRLLFVSSHPKGQNN